MTIIDHTRRTEVEEVDFLELEITRDCQLTCTHCYSNSGPSAGSGEMTTEDWLRVIAEASSLGIRTVQFIGGEPTEHPDLHTLARYALNRGLRVAVYSNLVDISRAYWTLFEDPSVRLSTSWYTDDPDQHRRITRSADAYERTLANIREALRLEIPLKVGVVEGIIPNQRSAEAVQQLREIGVTDIAIDTSRPVGRASRGKKPALSDLCGRCGDGRAAIDTDGQLSPCVLGRHMVAGNVRYARLGEILDGTSWHEIVESIPRRDRTCGPADSGDCDPAI